MSSNDAWIREYTLIFSSPSERIVISSEGNENPLDISFDISYEAKSSSQGTMYLDIHGLSTGNMKQISSVGVKVWLSVGHRGKDFSNLFIGDVRDTREVITNKGATLKTMCVASRVDVKPLNLILDEGTTHTVRIINLLKHIGQVMPSLNVTEAQEDILEFERIDQEESVIIGNAGDRDAVYDRTVLSDTCVGSLTIVSSVLDALKLVLLTFNIDVIIVNDTIHLTRHGGTFSKVNVISARLGENLLTPPKIKLDNMTNPVNSALAKNELAMTMLLSPEVKINSVLVANASRGDGDLLVEEDKVIKVSEIKHKGKYRGSAWNTEIVGYESQSFLSKAPIKSIGYEMTNPYNEPLPDEYSVDMFKNYYRLNR